MQQPLAVEALAFGDARRSRLIRWTSIGLGAFAVVAIIVYQLAGATERHRLAGDAALLLGCVVAWSLCRAGRIGPAASRTRKRAYAPRQDRRTGRSGRRRWRAWLNIWSPG